MTEPPPDRTARLQGLDRNGWSTLADRVMHGLCHDLSGRISALEGLTYLLGKGGEGNSLTPLVTEELERVEEVVHLLRLLPDDWEGDELLALGEILQGLAGLVHAQRGLEEVEIVLHIQPQAPAVRGDKTLLVRSLALLLTRLAEGARQSGAGRVRVTGRAEGGGLRLDLESGEGGPGSEEGGASLLLHPLPEAMEDSVAAGLVQAGIKLGRVGSRPGSPAFQLFFPSPFSP